jgi:rod shape-determining protein MreD
VNGYEIARIRKGKLSRFRPWVLPAVALTAILFQVYVPLFFGFLSHLEIPLLVTVYFSVMRRSPIYGVFLGASIGLVQDSLSHQPLGMYGIVKTLSGYTAASLGQRFDAEHPVMRLMLGFVFSLFQQISYWWLSSTLLGEPVTLSVGETAAVGLINGVVAVPLFALLDKLKETG